MPLPNPSASGEKKNHGNVLLWAIWSSVGVFALSALVFVLVYENNTDKAARLQRQAESQIQENDFRSAQATLKQIPDGYAGNARPLVDQVNAELQKASERRKEEEKQQRIAEQRAEEERRRERIKKQEAERLADAKENSSQNPIRKSSRDEAKELFKKQFLATQSVAERRRLANLIIDQEVPALQRSFERFAGEGWDAALMSKDIEKLILKCVAKPHDGRDGFVFEVQAVRDISAAGFQVDSCNERSGGTELDIRATNPNMDRQFIFECKDLQKNSFYGKKGDELIQQLNRQRSLWPNDVHVFYYNRSKEEIPDEIEKRISAAGFLIIARNRKPERGTRLIREMCEAKKEDAL